MNKTILVVLALLVVSYAIAQAEAKTGPKCGSGHCSADGGVCCGDSGFCCPSAFTCTTHSPPRCAPLHASAPHIPSQVATELIKGFESLQAELHQLITQEQKTAENLDSNTLTTTGIDSSLSSLTGSFDTSTAPAEAMSITALPDLSADSDTVSSTAPELYDNDNSSSNSTTAGTDVEGEVDTTNFNSTDVNAIDAVPATTRMHQFVELKKKLDGLKLSTGLQLSAAGQRALQFLNNRLTTLMHGTTYHQQYAFAHEYLMFSPLSPNRDAHANSASSSSSSSSSESSSESSSDSSSDSSSSCTEPCTVHSLLYGGDQGRIIEQAEQQQSPQSVVVVASLKD